MVKDATKEFVRNHRQLLRDLARRKVTERKFSAISPIAAAFLISVPPEDEETKSSEEETSAGSNGDTADLDEILARGVEH